MKYEQWTVAKVGGFLTFLTCSENIKVNNFLQMIIKVQCRCRGVRYIVDKTSFILRDKLQQFLVHVTNVLQFLSDVYKLLAYISSLVDQYICSFTGWICFVFIATPTLFCSQYYENGNIVCKLLITKIAMVDLPNVPFLKYNKKRIFVSEFCTRLIKGL